MTDSGYVRPLLKLDARSTSWEVPPWPSAFELARLLPKNTWTLVGGLMVKLHAELADLPAPRTTVDVDSTLHLVGTDPITFGEAAGILRGAGYVLNAETAHAYRFDRGPDQIDVMCTDRYPESKRPRYGGRPLFEIPGGRRALQQTINIDVATGTDTIRLVVPNIRGALVLKGAAYREDSRDRARHAEDAVVLLACMDDARAVTIDLSQESRKRIRSLVRALSESSAPWANHDPVVQSLARESLRDLCELMAN